MGRHEAPRTGNGQTGGAKPTKAQCSVKTSTGVTLWKATAKIFGSREK